MPMVIIADSSALVSLASRTDSNYNLAVSVGRSLEREEASVLVSGEIFAETLNVLGRSINKETVREMGEGIFSSSSLFIAETSDEIRRMAFAKFLKQLRSVSFTDCLVMAFADVYGTKNIFGFDEVFKKNGYVRLGLDRPV